jgi:antitoxin component YwqK of YwqJK toxin-antitoxin module
MDNEKCDLIHANGVKQKKLEEVDGYTIKYHANGKTMWSKGKIVDDKPEGYWEWYRLDGTLKRSGYFELGEPVGEWVTYDSQGIKYKATMRNK